ncbi:MAG: glycosyltransferase family 4 protein [Candidatus Helarchaeota archaeon]
MRRTIIFMAPTPPPYMGPTIATEIILQSKFMKEFNVIHIDTADRRSLSNLGKIDLMNVYLAFKHYIQLLKHLISSNADLVYLLINQTTGGFLRDIPFIIISKIFNKKVVLHLRGGYFRKFYNSSNIIMQFIIKRTLVKIDRMIILGYSLKKIFQGLIPEEKLSIVPNGLDIKFNEKKQMNRSHFTILFLSNFMETKGYKDVLYSVKKVINNNSNVKYKFAGSWVNDIDKLECKIVLKEEKIEKFVEFISPIRDNEKMKLLQNVDIFLFPSYNEGHPWVIIEAMAARLPIITTDVGCLSECVINGENGFIVPKGDPDVIAEKIIYLLSHPAIRRRMGYKSREYYEQNFTERHFVQRLIDAINVNFSA